MRNETELAKKNVELSFEFNRFLLTHPAINEDIPDNALIVFHVADDVELTRFNDDLVKRTREPHQPIVIVQVKGLATTRLIEPTVSVSV